MLRADDRTCQRTLAHVTLRRMTNERVSGGFPLVLGATFVVTQLADAISALVAAKFNEENT